MEQAAIAIEGPADADRRFLREVLEWVADTAYTDLAGLGKSERRARLDAVFARHYDDEGAIIRVARQGETPVGAAWLQRGWHPVTDAAEVVVIALGVIPAFRGQGVARALMRDALGHVRLGESMRLFVAHDNAAALALYAGLGFAPATVELVLNPGQVRASLCAPPGSP